MLDKKTHRLALATCAAIPGIHPDDAHLVVALERLGIEAVPCIWNDPAVDWSRFDAILIRTIWDYFKQYPAFLAWLDRLPVPTINDPALLRWNGDKRYLLELAERGVPVIATELVSGTQLPHALSSMAGRDVVVKPATSGGAWHTVLGTVGDDAFAQAVAALPAELDYLVQPFVPEIASDGEWSLLFFDGVYSHSVLKRPKAGDYRVQTDFGGSLQAAEPDAALIESARQALEPLAALGHPDHAYVRVDGVVVDGRFLLMELEMIEPALFLTGRPEAAERFAANLRRRLDALATSRKALA